VFFCDFRLRRTLQERIATKWLKINQDNVRIGTAKAVARLMSFAQNTCLNILGTFLYWQVRYYVTIF